MAGTASMAIVGHSFVAGLESFVTRDAACMPDRLPRDVVWCPGGEESEIQP